MSDAQYNESAIEEAPLIDSAQWERLQTELGDDMLAEFSEEFFDEAKETWIEPDQDPFSLEDKAFCSLSHRTAGAAGTLGFKKLRVSLLCMEHSSSRENSKVYFEHMKDALSQTQEWVKAQF